MAKSNDGTDSQSTSSKTKSGYGGHVPTHRPGPGPLAFPLPGESSAAHIARIDRLGREYKDRQVASKADALLADVLSGGGK